VYKSIVIFTDELHIQSFCSITLHNIILLYLMFPQLLRYRDATTIMASLTCSTIYRFRFNNINEIWRGNLQSWTDPSSWALYESALHSCLFGNRINQWFPVRIFYNYFRFTTSCSVPISWHKKKSSTLFDYYWVLYRSTECYNSDRMTFLTLDFIITLLSLLA